MLNFPTKDKLILFAEVKNGKHLFNFLFFENDYEQTSYNSTL